jgi:hypothetical protein
LVFFWRLLYDGFVFSDAHNKAPGGGGGQTSRLIGDGNMTSALLATGVARQISLATAI